MNLTQREFDYIKACVLEGTPLHQAVAQCEVLEEESRFKENLLSALSDNVVIEKIKSLGKIEV